jgi:hypothetical protein
MPLSPRTGETGCLFCLFCSIKTVFCARLIKRRGPVYIDDGLLTADTAQLALSQSGAARATLEESGFTLNHKCRRIPSRSAT